MLQILKNIMSEVNLAELEEVSFLFHLSPRGAKNEIYFGLSVFLVCFSLGIKAKLGIVVCFWGLF